MKNYRLQSLRYTPYKCTRHVASVFLIYLYYIHIHLAHEYIFPQHPIPAPPTHGSSSAPRNAHRTIPEGGEILSLKENMHMVGVDSYFYDLDIHLYTCLTNYPLTYHCDITNQQLSPVFRGEHHMISQQRHRMPVVTQLFPVNITTVAFTGSSAYINTG